MNSALMKDGRTRQLQRVQKMVENVDYVLAMEDFIYESGKLNELLNECFQKWEDFSCHRFVMNLLDMFALYDGEDDQLEKYYEEIENSQKLSDDSEKLLENLAKKIRSKIREIDTEGIRNQLLKKYSIKTIKNNLQHMETDFFLELFAPLLELDRALVDFFMYRAFHKEFVNNYIDNQFLLELAIDLHIRTGEKEPLIVILYKLKAFYDSVSVEESGEDTQLAERGTRYIADIKEQVMKGIEVNQTAVSFDINDYESVKNMLIRYKALERPTRRDRTGKYEELLGKICELYEEELRLFIEENLTDKDNLDNYIVRELDRIKERIEESLSVPVTVWYDSHHNTTEYIEMGTAFKGKISEYVLKREVELPPTEYVTELIHVVPHQDNNKLKKPGSNGMPEKLVLNVLEGNCVIKGKELIREVRTESIKNIDESLDSNKWTMPKWRTEFEKGYVVMEILKEEKIPDELCIEHKEFKFVLEDDRIERLADLEASHPDYEQIRVHMKPHPDNYMKGNEKKEDGNEDENDKKIKKNPIFVPENTEFQVINGNREVAGKPVIQNVRTVKVKEKHNRKWKPLRWGMADRSGFVVLEVLAGESLPENLVFEYNGFKFLPIDDYCKQYDRNVTFEVRLDEESLDKNKVKEEKTAYVIEDKNAINQILSDIPIIKKIGNENNRVAISKKLLAEYEEQENLWKSVIEGNDLKPVWREFMYEGRYHDSVIESINLNIGNSVAKWMKASRIEGDTEWFAKLEESRQRSVIIVMLFLIYVKGISDYIDSKEQFLRDFEMFVDSEMNALRFDGLYLGYAIDCLVLFLLATCAYEEACETLRAVYKVIAYNEENVYEI